MMSNQDKQISTKRKLISMSCLIIGVLLIFSILCPIIFAFVFHSNDSSQFMHLFDTDVSVSDWFSFWTSYLSSFQSFLLSLPGVLLAIWALTLTWQIENERLYEVESQNKTLFVIQEIKITVSDANYKIIIGLHPDIIKLKALKVLNATLTIENEKNKKVEIPLVADSTEINGINSDCNGSHLNIYLSQNYEGYDEVIRFWKCQNQHMSCYNKDAILRIHYSYGVLKSTIQYEDAFGKKIFKLLNKVIKLDAPKYIYSVSSTSVLNVGVIMNTEKILCSTQIQLPENKNKENTL